MLGKFIRGLRAKNKLTQEDVALRLGLSRPTYIEIENGMRDLTVKEADQLAGIFGISREDLLDECDNAIPVKLEEAKGEKAKQTTLRISVPAKNVTKFKEVLLYVLSKVGSKPNVGETVLYKLLYFIDFDFYEKYEEQLIGATYIKNHYGPTPVEFKAVIEDMIKKEEVDKIKSKYFNHEQRKYLPIRDPDLTKFSAQELQHIDEVLGRLSDKNANKLTEYSHDDVPWIIAKENKAIDYEAVFYRTPKTSVRNYEQPDQL